MRGFRLQQSRVISTHISSWTGWSSRDSTYYQACCSPPPGSCTTWVTSFGTVPLLSRLQVGCRLTARGSSNSEKRRLLLDIGSADHGRHDHGIKIPGSLKLPGTSQCVLSVFRSGITQDRYCSSVISPESSLRQRSLQASDTENPSICKDSSAVRMDCSMELDIWKPSTHRS